jgi:hypothetical protein
MRARSSFVRPEEQHRVRCPVSLGKTGAIDHVTFVDRQCYATPRFCFSRPWLCVLPRKSSHPNYRLLAPVDDNQAHLKQNFESVDNGLGLAFLEAFGAVATLQQKSLPSGRLSEPGL